MRPTPQQEAWSRQGHRPELAVQREHERAAMQNRQNFARENHGRPAVAATARPADFSRHAVVPARAAGGEWRAPAISPREARVKPNVANRGNVNNQGNRGKQESRPFTAPARGGAAVNDRGGNNGRLNDPAANRTNDRPPQNRGNENRNNVYRPTDNRPAPNRMTDRPAQSRPPENRMNQNRPAQNRAPENRMNQGRPQSPPREMSRPQQNVPRENSRPAPAPRREGAPPKGDHRGR